MNEEKYELIVNEIRQNAGKTPLSVPNPRLIAVSKGQPWEKINDLWECGQRVFGENRWQEAKERWGRFRIQDDVIDGLSECPQTGQGPARSGGGLGARPPFKEKLELHFIGPLQTNKVPEVVNFFDCIHSLDRPKLADALHKAGCQLPCFIQVNTGEEPQKAGVMPQETVAFIRYCREERQLNIVGLMCVPPVGVNPVPHFAFLRELAQEQGLPRLSMGMSSDWQLALRMGATDLRIGSALFGERE